MEQLYGIFLYAVFLLTMGGIYAVLCLGLNIQWGYTGLFNAGVAGFFAIGAYVTAIVTSAASDRHLGGFGLGIPAGICAAMVASANRRVGHRTHLHPAAQRLSRNRDAGDRGDPPTGAQERDLGNQRGTRHRATRPTVAISSQPLLISVHPGPNPETRR